MFRSSLCFFTAISAFWPAPAFAHWGHVGELAGHGHLIGLGALVGAAALAEALRRARKKNKDNEEEELEMEPEGETA